MDGETVRCGGGRGGSEQARAPEAATGLDWCGLAHPGRRAAGWPPGSRGSRLAALAAVLAPLAGFALLAPIEAPPVLAAPLQAAPPPLWIGDTRRQVEAKLPLAQQRPAGETLLRLARQLLGRPYKAFSLDAEPQERLRLDLTGFDCALLVEQLLALIHSRNVVEFSEQVQRLRYGNGDVDYCDRNHYFTVWAANAERLGLVKDITESLPGASLRVRRLNFMSSHPNSYRPMRQARARQCIAALERNLSVRQSYVPIGALGSAAAKLRSGDIFALVTAVDGLDVSHTGFLERSRGELHAIHAAPKRGVMRSLDFVRYASSVEDVVGISILRPLPRAARPR